MYKFDNDDDVNVYGAVFKLGERQTKASLTAPCKYVTLMCQTTATLCAMAVCGKLPPQVEKQRMGIQMGANLQLKQAVTSAGAEYFGRSDPAAAIYHAVLHGLYPPEFQAYLAQGTGRAHRRGETICLFSPTQPKQIFALCDGIDAYVFQLNMSLFRHTDDWSHSWVDVRVSHVKTCYHRQGIAGLPDDMADRMNAARKKDGDMADRMNAASERDFIKE